ncbi:hypothetical protein ACOYXV_06750 [Aeromonas veronii]
MMPPLMTATSNTMADNKAHPLAQHIPTGKGDDDGKHPPGLVDKQSAQGERKHQGDMHRLRHLGTMHSDLMQLPQQIDQIEDHIESDHSNHPIKISESSSTMMAGKAWLNLVASIGSMWAPFEKKTTRATVTNINVRRQSHRANAEVDCDDI